MGMTESQPRRGRPPLAEITDLRTRALGVILRVGYQQASMSQIASEVGLSVRTLHRYFPAKADIVWGGIERSLDALSDGLRHANGELPVIEAITAVVVAVFDQNTDDGAVDRARLRLIATTPELRAARPETFELWRAQLIGFIGDRLGEPAGSLVPWVMGAAVQTTITEALAWWALHERTRGPGEVVERALGSFNSVTAGLSPPVPSRRGQR